MRQPGPYQSGWPQPQAVGLPLPLARLQHTGDAAGFPIQSLVQQASGAEAVQRLAHPAQAVTRESGGGVVVGAGQWGNQGCGYAGAALGCLRVGFHHGDGPSPAGHRVGDCGTAHAGAYDDATGGPMHVDTVRLAAAAHRPGWCKSQSGQCGGRASDLPMIWQRLCLLGRRRLELGETGCVPVRQRRPAGSGMHTCAGLAQTGQRLDGHAHGVRVYCMDPPDFVSLKVQLAQHFGKLASAQRQANACTVPGPAVKVGVGFKNDRRTVRQDGRAAVPVPSARDQRHVMQPGF